MPVTTLPNMNLAQPGILTEPGPTWAGDLNADLALIDAHNHTSGKGVQVPSAGLNINANLPFNNNAPTGMAYATLNAAAAPVPTSTILNSVYVAQVSGRNELFYQDGNGINVQLTSTGAVNQNGTSTANNGFTGAGYNTSGGAYAIWNSAPATYSFTTNGTVLASIAAANIFSYGTLYTASGGSLAAPNAGFAFQGTNGLLSVLFDSGSSGNFVNTAFQYDGTNARLIINPTSGPSPAAGPSSFDAYNASATGTALSTARLLSKFGTTATGQGPAQEFWSNTGAVSYVRQAQIAGFWSTVGGNAGLNLTTAASGTLAASPALQILNSAGTQTLGLLGGAVAGQGVTTYADIIPATSNTHSLGSATLEWVNLYTSNVIQPGSNVTLALASGTAGDTSAVSSWSDGGFAVRNRNNTDYAGLTAKTINATSSMSASAATFGPTTINGNLTVTGTISQAGTTTPILRAAGKVQVGFNGIYNAFGLAQGIAVSYSATNPGSQALDVWTLVLSAPLPNASYTIVLGGASFAGTTGGGTADIYNVSDYGYAAKSYLASDLKTLTLAMKTAGGNFSSDTMLYFAIFA